MACFTANSAWEEEKQHAVAVSVHRWRWLPFRAENGGSDVKMVADWVHLPRSLEFSEAFESWSTRLLDRIQLLKQWSRNLTGGGTQDDVCGCCRGEQRCHMAMTFHRSATDEIDIFLQFQELICICCGETLPLYGVDYFQSIIGLGQMSWGEIPRNPFQCGSQKHWSCRISPDLKQFPKDF